MIPREKIEKRSKAPPEKRLKKPKNLRGLRKKL